MAAVLMALDRAPRIGLVYVAIKNRIEKYGFIEGEDFTLHKFVERRATVIDYHLTIEVAKELAMIENNEKGREVRRYFIDQDVGCANYRRNVPLMS